MSYASKEHYISWVTAIPVTLCMGQSWSKDWETGEEHSARMTRLALERNLSYAQGPKIKSGFCADFYLGAIDATETQAKERLRQFIAQSPNTHI